MMKIANYVFVNQYLDVQDNEGNMMVGRVETVDEQAIVLSDITRKEKLVLSEMIKRDVFVFFVGNDKLKYQFQTRMERIEGEPLKIKLHAPDPADIIKIQNRDYLRIGSSVRCDLKVEEEPEQQLEIYTHDISGGGLSFYTRTPVEHDKYSGTMYLYKGENEISLPFKADLVYMNELDAGRYKVALQYSDIKEQHRNHIIRYAIQEQVKVRK
ncbi:MULTISPECIES: flagellar brake protein [Paenibacillus]|uniref:flagellar brake protein n=1 Tax=Paenibacillus TaxID=44249 RepID=UPI0009DAA2DB|nr:MULTISPECIES: PilZ domain-containing protein [Paenibacillus]